MREVYCFKGDVGNILDTKIVLDYSPIMITFYKNYKRSSNKIIEKLERTIDQYLGDLFNDRVIYNTFTYNENNGEISNIKTVCECFLNAIDSIIFNNNKTVIKEINLINIIKTIIMYIEKYTNYTFENFSMPDNDGWIKI